MAKRRSELTAPEPIEVINVLSRYEDVHTPHSRDNVHWKNNSTQDSQFAQHICCLLLTLVHADVDLREVIRMGTGEQTITCQHSEKNEYRRVILRLIMAEIASHS